MTKAKSCAAGTIPGTRAQNERPDTIRTLLLCRAGHVLFKPWQAAGHLEPASKGNTPHPLPQATVLITYPERVTNHARRARARQAP